jgi:hypothetical protein
MYKILGFIVWHVAKLVLRRKYGHLVPSRRIAAIGIVGVAVAGLALGAARRESVS